MALHESYGDFNKLEDTLPVVRYVSEPSTYTDADGFERVMFWTLTRILRHHYSYIGLTKDAAEDCAAALRERYTRKYLNWTATIKEDEGGEPYVRVFHGHTYDCTSSVTPRLVAGDNWTVDVSVEEEDVIVSTKELATTLEIESAFQEALGETDGDREIVSGKFTVYGANWNSLTNRIEANFTHKVNGYDERDVVVEVKSGGVWSQVTAYVHGNEIAFDSNSNATFRLNYRNGELLSNEVTTASPVLANLVTESGTLEVFYSHHPAGLLETSMRLSAVFNSNGTAFSRLRQNFIMYLRMPGHAGFIDVQPYEVEQIGTNRFRLNYIGRLVTSGDISNATVDVSYVPDGRNIGQVAAMLVNYVAIGSIELESQSASSGSRTFDFIAHVTSDRDLTASSMGVTLNRLKTAKSGSITSVQSTGDGSFDVKFRVILSSIASGTQVIGNFWLSWTNPADATQVVTSDEKFMSWTAQD